MDRLTSARVFLEIADRGSLTQAAERLEMSPAMVSRHLAAAEEWMGARLLHRTTRRVSLTDAGQTALVTCRQLLELAEDLQQRTRDPHREPEATLRVTSSASFADAQLTQALIDFQRQHAKVRIELIVHDRAVDLVEDRIDLAVRITNTLDPTLVSRTLTTCRSVLCAAPAYLKARGRPATPDALQSHSHVSHAFTSGTSYRLRSPDGADIEVPVTSALHANETAVLCRAALLGAGIAMLPTYFVSEHLRRGELIRVLPDHEPQSLGIHAVYLSRRHQPLALRLLLDFLAARFGSPTPPWDQGIGAQPSTGR